jgi:acetyltransferase-like isoleucine patch superfamily enzyme
MNSLLTKLYYARAFLRFRAFGSNIKFMRGGLIARPEEIQLGSNIFIARNFFISARSLSIGSNVMAGPNLVIECDDHKYDTVGVTMYDNRNEKNAQGVTIEDDVWMGANVTLLKGVTIGEGCAIGAGSVVTRSIPPYSIAVGNPCRPIKARFAADQMRVHLSRVASRHTCDAVLGMLRDANLLPCEKVVGQ